MSLGRLLLLPLLATALVAQDVQLSREGKMPEGLTNLDLAARDGVRGGLYRDGDGKVLVELLNSNPYDVQVEYRIEPKISVQPGEPVIGKALIEANSYWTEGPQRRRTVTMEQPSLVVRMVKKVELEVSESVITDADGRQSEVKTYRIKTHRKP